MPPLNRPRLGACRPWAHVRHRSRYGLSEQLRRDYGGPCDHRDDVLALVPPAARRDMLSDAMGRA